MNPRELSLAVTALHLQVLYDQCNPEVGMGPFLDTQADRLLGALFTKPEIERIKEVYLRKYPS